LWLSKTSDSLDIKLIKANVFHLDLSKTLDKIDTSIIVFSPTPSTSLYLPPPPAMAGHKLLEDPLLALTRLQNLPSFSAISPLLKLLTQMALATTKTFSL
jgi:hypothetical protein